MPPARDDFAKFTTSYFHRPEELASFVAVAQVPPDA
jgi:hypothetical protein